MNKTNKNQEKEIHNKRMIPICILRYLMENTNSNKRATVQEISDGLKNYQIFANRDTVQKTLTDLIDRKEELLSIGFPKIRYDEIKRKNKNYVEKATKTEDDEDDKWQTMLTGFYVSPEEDTGALGGPRLSDGELAFLLNLLADGRMGKDLFVEELAQKLESLGEAQKVLVNATSGAAARKETLGAKHLSEAVRTINEAIKYKMQIRFRPRHYNRHLKLERDDLLTFEPYFIIGNNLIGVISGDYDIKSFRIDKLDPYPERESTAEIDDTETPNPIIRLKTDRQSNKSDFEIATYLSRHPDLDNGRVVRVIINLREDAIDEFVDTFGTDFGSRDGIRSESAGEPSLKSGYLRASLHVSFSFMLKWALKNADKCEILEPQSLRDQIGVAAHTLAESVYLKDEKDYYRDAILAAKKNGKLKLNIPGFETRKEHESLTGIKWLHINSPQISDIGFVWNYNELRSAMLTTHLIDDYSVCGYLPCLQSLFINAKTVKNLDFLKTSKSLRCLYVFKTKIDNLDALYERTSLEVLVLDTEEIAKLDIKRVRAANPLLVIKKYNMHVNLEEINWESDVDRSFTDRPYPLNVIYTTHNIYHPERNKTQALFDISPDKFGRAEFQCVFERLYEDSDELTRRAVSLVFKEGYTVREAAHIIFGTLSEYKSKKEEIVEKFKLKSGYTESDLQVEILRNNMKSAVTDLVLNRLNGFGNRLKSEELFREIYKENKAEVETPEVKERLRKRQLDVIRGRNV